MSELSDQKGVTLLEFMLVMAIMVSIFVLGIRLYSQLAFQQRENQLLASVNQLFKAAQGYYYFNCRQQLDAQSNAQSPGALDPAVIGTRGTVYLDVDNDLVKPGFISSKWQPNSPLLNPASSSTPFVSYFVQFNRVQNNNADPTMGVTACSAYGASPNTSNCTETSGLSLDSSQTGSPYPNPNPSATSSSVTWVVQVGVQLSPSLSTMQKTQIKNDLNAQCFTTKSGNGLTPCPTSPSPNPTDYIIWTRHPSYFINDITSDYWTSDPYVKQFKMQYTNDGTGALSGVTKDAPTWYNANNYLCGG